MLELLDTDDLQAIADSLTAGPGPHSWMWGTADIFYCSACFVSFEFGAEPVPNGPCEPIDPSNSYVSHGTMQYGAVNPLKKRERDNG